MTTVLMAILVLAVFLSLFRIFQGPTISDRMVGVDIMSILFVGITALTAIVFNLSYLLDLAVALAMVSFVGVLALAKYLEKRSLDD